MIEVSPMYVPAWVLWIVSGILFGLLLRLIVGVIALIDAVAGSYHRKDRSCL